MRNKNSIILFLGISIVFLLTACAKDGDVTTQNTDHKISQSTQETSGESTDTPAGDEAGRIREAFGPLIPEGQVQHEKYVADEFAEDRYDDLSEWKDKDGNWCYPKGYKIRCIGGDDSALASQQFPEELLNQMTTEELYEFIMKAPGSWSHYVYDTYMQALSTYYVFFNFMANLMEREDCAQVALEHYEKYTEDDIQKYSKMHLAMYEDEEKQAEQGRFQLAEGLAWFFLYLDDKSVPDDTILGITLTQDND